MSLLGIPTTAAGTMPLVQIQRDCSTAFVILDSAGMDTTVQVWESMIALPFQRVKYTWPPNLLVHKNFDSPFFVFCFSSKTHYLITLIMTYIFLIIYLFFGLIKLSLLQLLHCMLKPLFFYEHWVRSVDFIADIDECVTSTHNCSMDNCDFYKY